MQLQRQEFAAFSEAIFSRSLKSSVCLTRRVLVFYRRATDSSLDWVEPQLTRVLVGGIESPAQSAVERSSEKHLGAPSPGHYANVIPVLTCVQLSHFTKSALAFRTPGQLGNRSARHIHMPGYYSRACPVFIMARGSTSCSQRKSFKSSK